MKYKILYSEDIVELESIVNRYLQNGWQCIGTLVIDSFTHTGYYGSTKSCIFYQAVVGEIK